METEVPKVPAKKKEPSKRAAAAQKKKPLATVSEISDDDDDDNDINEIDDDDNEDSEIEVVAASEARKKGGRNLAANAKAVKAPAAAKKRGAANKQQPQTLGQKLLTDMLKPAKNSEISLEKKVRKMRASPFNKKSGSVLGRVGKVNEVTENEENLGSASTSASTEETIEVAPARARPQRVNRAQTRVTDGFYNYTLNYLVTWFLRTIPLKDLEMHVNDLLQERCKREAGDEWPKISHIQNIKINSKSVQKDCQLPLDSD